jgi:hypothetical protein
MSRGPCRGRCPVYTIAIHGNGLVQYAGERFVKDRGPETSPISREQIIAVLQSLDRAHFLTLDDRAFAWCFDTPSVGILVSADGSFKRVVSDGAADLADDAVMGNRLPHRLGRSGHWREC